jgi:pimeloyl-ACP methyl ester carboxylesterase
MGPRTLLVLLLLPFAAPARTQFLTFTSSVDGSAQPYALYLPESANPSQGFPLLVSLHTEDSNHRLNLRQILGPPDRAGRSGTGDAPFAVACPYARGSMGYRGIAEQDVYDMLGDVQRRFPVDPDRVYLTGASMGGGGALWLALTHPDRWAAVAPLCAAAPPGSEELAANLANLPVRFYHGEQDTIVPVQASRAWQRRLLDLGIPVSYMEYPSLRHNAWDMAYKPGALFDWLMQFHRNRRPERVRFATRAYRYAEAYWVRIDGLTPGALAEVDAVRNSGVVVKTKNVDGFTLTLEKAVASVVIDGATVRVQPGAQLSFEKRGARWQPGLYRPSGKRPGAEGPIEEAFSGRPIFIYGTLGVRSDAELDERRKVAQRAANWSSPRLRVDFAPPVKADADVTDRDLATSDVVLFGNAATNSVVARLSASRPLSLDPGAADYGLLFIAPVGRHYALVSSGLPWWTEADQAKRALYAFAPEPLALVATFGDYILFKGSLAHVVTEGRFDRNWKLPPEAAARISAAGTVTIQ